MISLATLPFDVSLPPRTAATLLFAVIVLNARFVSYPIVVGCFLVALAYDFVTTFALQFTLPPSEFAVAIKHAMALNLFSSPLYVGMAAAVTAQTVTALWLLTPRHRPHLANPLVVFAVAIVVAIVDFVGHVSPHYYFGNLIAPHTPVESASRSSGFGEAVGAPRRNVVVVMVESMGHLADAQARDWVAAPLATPEIKARYRVTAGTTPYFASTTAAEMRELCDTRIPYTALDAARGAQCLPARLKRNGYTTMAFHGLTGAMFDRTDWYPLIGFDRILFGDEMLRKTQRECGTVFRGGCDVDMERLIKRAVNGAKSPFLVYWLTLNTHVPVAPVDAGPTPHCDGAVSHDVCVMSTMWRQVFESVARLALDPRIGPAEVLVVGDHGPPLWSLRGRAQFEPGLVTWYRLTPN